MIKKLLLSLLAILAFASFAFAQQPTDKTSEENPEKPFFQDYKHDAPNNTDPFVEIDTRYWMPELDARVRVTESGVGTTIDASTDLGLADEEFPEGRIIFNLGPVVKLRLGCTLMNYAGDETVTRDIEFAGETFTSGSRVVSDFDLKYFSLGLMTYFFSTSDEKLKIGGLLEGKCLMADISLKAPDLPVPLEESHEVIGGLPTVGLVVEYSPFKMVNVFAEASGLFAGDYGYFCDVEAGARIILFENIALAGGYRMVRIEVDFEENFGELELSGPFAQVTIKF
jgi:hypothetical protein